MSLFPEDDRPKPKRVHEIGQDLSMLSLEEIEERITALKVEIERLVEARTKKSASRAAADAFFPQAGLKKPARKALVKSSLMIPKYESDHPDCLDVEWLLPTLFDASLLTLRAALWRLFFYFRGHPWLSAELPCSRHRLLPPLRLTASYRR